jgi:uncharacterized protein YebE (UPF0316 family)
MDAFFDQPAVLVVAIFLARIGDVSLSTLRTILVFRGHRYIAAGIGFFETLLWLAAAAKVLQNLDTWYLAVAYAAGFASGNIVGIWLESKLAMGVELVRAVSKNPSVDLAKRLNAQGYDVVQLAGSRSGGPVEVLLVVEKRRRIRNLLRFIDQVDPEAYCTVSDVKERASQYHGAPEGPGLPPPTAKRK